MGHCFYKTKLSDEKLIELFDLGLYSANLAEGTIFNRWGKEVRWYKGNAENHRFVRIYGNGGSRATSIHRIIWIVGCRTSIPVGWEVHHRNLDCTDNRFSNLFCLHPVDHRKLHSGMDLIDDTPF